MIASTTLKLLTKVLPTKKLVLLVLLMLDQQTVSGYGASVTFHFDKARREEIIRELKL